MVRKKTLFKEPKFSYLSDIISFKNPTKAEESARELRKEFSKAKTRTKKLRIARATQYAANRAMASSKRKNLSPKERDEIKKISKIYDKTAEILFNKYNKSKI